MKLHKKILYIFLLTFSIIIIGETSSNASNQMLNSLDFQAYINDDGSMKVIEDWDIEINETNTLFKNFKKDKSKFSNITNVKVTDMTSGKNLTKIYQEMYHVTKDCYYALDIMGNKFEIAWGVGLDNSSDTRKYRIEYTVEDVISKYNDCAELYWQFVGDNFDINAKSITGTIHLPNTVKSKDEIKVWGHTQQLNGEIYITDLDTINFYVKNFNPGNFVEVRIVMPTQIVNNLGVKYNIEKLQTIIDEEKVWADEANKIRIYEKIKDIVIIIVIFLLIIFLDIILIGKIKKYKKLIGNESIITPSQEIKYFRDIPREDASPAEAGFLIMKNRFSFYSSEMGNIFSAILLNLYHNDYIDIQVDKNNKKNIKFILKLTEEQIKKIKNIDEKNIYYYLLKASSGNIELTLDKLKKYISHHSSELIELQVEIETKVKEKLYSKNYINKIKENEYIKYRNIKTLYTVMMIVIICCCTPFFLLLATWLILPLIITLLLIYICIRNITKVNNHLNIYSQEAIDEMEMWKGLKKFMKDLSQIDKKEIPEVVLWEKYLIYATAFGIADEVLKQLRIIYPDFDTQVEMSTSTHINVMLGANIGNVISSSINTSISSAYSSGSGGGGGFSGGGRRRWRPAEAEAVDSLKNIKYSFL